MRWMTWRTSPVRPSWSVFIYSVIAPATTLPPKFQKSHEKRARSFRTVLALVPAAFVFAISCSTYFGVRTYPSFAMVGLGPPDCVLMVYRCTHAHSLPPPHWPDTCRLVLHHIPDCLLMAYQCACAHLPPPPPWSYTKSLKS
jgi:hypothetical protein